MIIRSILHSTWIEWREQRSNLLGLWAGLLLLILAMALFGGFDLVTDGVAPISFALLGYLGFVIAIMPRIFAGPTQRSTEAMQRRCPAGIHGNFIGKALFLNLALALTALLPALAVLGLMYFAAPRNYEALMSERFSKDALGLGLGLYALPLVLMTWRLPVRWTIGVLLLATALVLGLLSLGALGAFTTPQGYSLFTNLALIALLVMPWLLAWSSFTMTRGATKLHRSIVGLGLAFIVVSPALAVGLGGYVRNGFSLETFSTESEGFSVLYAYLGPKGEQAYLTSFDGSALGNLFDFLENPRHNRIHAIRVDLTTGAVEHWPDYSFLHPTDEGLQEIGPATYPHVSDLILHERTGGSSDAFQAIDLVTHELTPIDPERIASDYRSNAEAMGLAYPWFTRDTNVGLGVHLIGRSKNNTYRKALYDISRDKVFYGQELPFDIDQFDRRILVLPGRWLIGPERDDEPWMMFDPDSNTFEPARGLVEGTSIGRALPDGKVIVCNGNQFSLYNVNEGTCEPLLSIDGPATGPSWTFWNSRRYRQACEPASIILVTGRPHDPIPQDGRKAHLDAFLGRLNRDTHEIQWLPWSRQNRIMGAFDEDSLLVIQGSKRLVKIDLNTGEETLLFPRPSTLE